MSDLALAIIGYLKIKGPSTAVEIAEGLNEGLPEPRYTSRSVSSALCWMRGGCIVQDGSISTRIGFGFAHTDPPPGPIRWSLRDDREWSLDARREWRSHDLEKELQGRVEEHGATLGL